VKNRYPEDIAIEIPHEIFKLNTDIINGIKIFKIKPKVAKYVNISFCLSS